MSTHETRVADGRLYVEDGDGDWLDVGRLADVYDVVGGETVGVEYDSEEATYGAPWLDTDSDNVLTIDVRETLEDMTFPTSFVEKLAARPLEEAGDRVPERTDYFADTMHRVWTSHGDLPDDENPFL
jgi:hypothetical protein